MVIFSTMVNFQKYTGAQSNMLPCFKCLEVLPNAIDLCNHIKNDHEMSGRNSYLCLICNSRCSYLWRLKKHLQRHEINAANQEGTETENIFRRPPVNADLEAYRKLSQSAALEFACKMAGNMNVPRTETFSVIGHVEKFLSSIADGLKTLMMPWLKNDKLCDFERSVTSIAESFKKINTERKLDKFLYKQKLMSSVRKVKFNDNDENVEEVSVTMEAVSTSLEDYSITESESESDENAEGDSLTTEAEGENVDGTSTDKPKSATLMPISFQFKSFFESGAVFKKVKENTDNIVNDGQLNHYINGTSWKAKRGNFGRDDLVIPFHLHIDDTQTNNSLGTHKENGIQTCVYYSFPTIPNEYLSRLDNIFTAMMFQSSLNKNDRCYTELIDELNKLADDGIVLNIEGKEEIVFFVLGLVLGDNKGVNECLGFSKGFTARYYCRFCRLRRNVMQRSYEEVSNKVRNRENYEADLLKKNFKATGIHKNLVFNR